MDGRRWAGTIATLAVLWGAAAAQAAPAPAPWAARHDLSSSAYQAAFKQFTGQGLRLTSISGYLKNGAVRYAATWQKVDGPPWIARHGLSGAAYQKAFSANAKAGYRLVYVSAFDTPKGNRYAAIWEKRTGPPLRAFHGLTSGAYQKRFSSLTKSGYRLLHVAGYSRGSAARYAAIFEKSSGPAWVSNHGLTYGDFQKRYTSLTKQGFRLKVMNGFRAGGKDRYVGIWEKSSGPALRARHGIPGSSYQRLFDIDRHQGFWPVAVHGFTSGSTTRFTTLWHNAFSKQDLAKLQAAGTNFLKNAGEPQTGLSVAIAKDGRLVWASGYGLADREAKVAMDVGHRLRIGSISKAITAVTLYKIMELGGLPPAPGGTGLDHRVFGPGGILGAEVQVPASMKDLESATLRQFLDHTSGLPGTGPRNGGNTPPFLRPQDPVNCGAGNLYQRITAELARHASASAAAGRAPLNGKPGEWPDYSNLSHVIAEAVIEKLTKTSYSTFVRGRVFQPAGITRAGLFSIGPYKAGSSEAKHYTPSGSYAEYAAKDTCENEPPGVGAGGWAMTPRDLLRWFVGVDGLPAREMLSPPNFLDSVTAPTSTMTPTTYARSWITGSWGWCGTGSQAITHGHNGGLSGAYSNLFQLANGYSFAIIGNQSIRPNGGCHDGVKPFLDLLTQIDWPEHDLF